MKTYAHFTENGVSQTGSDAWYQLDSRNTLETQKRDARDRLHALRFVKPWYNGFEIHKGESLRQTRCIYAVTGIDPRFARDSVLDNPAPALA